MQLNEKSQVRGEAGDPRRDIILLKPLVKN